MHATSGTGMRFAVYLLASCAALAFVTPGRARGDMVELPPLPDPALGHNNAEVFDMNGAGQIVGVSFKFSGTPTAPSFTGQRAVLWTPDGVPHDIGLTLETPGSPPTTASISVARGINQQGHVVGFVVIPDRPNRAFIYMGQGNLLNLGALEPGRRSQAAAINDNDEIVGLARITGPDGGPRDRAVLFTNGTVVNLGTLPGGDSSEAMSINNAGVISGISNDTPGGPPLPVMWDETGQIHALDGPVGFAFDINESDQISGFAFGNGDETQPLFWEAPELSVSKPAILQQANGCPAGPPSGGAFGVSDSGEIIGFLGVNVGFPAGAETTIAAYWRNSSDPSPICLGTLGGASSVGFAISEAGVAGSSRTADELFGGRGFVLWRDDDAVANDIDECPFSASGAVVDPLGCSIADYCPCTGAWKNHGAYLSCVSHAADNFVAQQVISSAEKDAVLAQAGGSSCGK